MREDASLERYILDILEEQLYQRGLHASSPLLEDGLLDSLGFVDLILRIEQDLNVTIGVEDTDLDVFATPRSIAEHVGRIRADASGPRGVTTTPLRDGNA